MMMQGSVAAASQPASGDQALQAVLQGQRLEGGNGDKKDRAARTTDAAFLSKS
jgi:hypothetical protein